MYLGLYFAFAYILTLPLSHYSNAERYWIVPAWLRYCMHIQTRSLPQ